jgi:hypothetical protein
MNPLQSLRDYEAFVYTLPQQYPIVASSSLVVFQADENFATVRGDLYFVDGYRLVVRERLNMAAQPLVILSYGYEVWRNAEKLYWYDPQPHPHIPELAATHPHHKHVPPDIRHNRVPAPGLSFGEPNLPFLIGEIEQILLNP